MGQWGVEDGVADKYGGLSRRYGWIGAALGLGAPLGLLLFRRFLSREGGAVSEGATDWRLPLLYMTATTPVVFGAFGYILGRSQDKMRAAQEQIQRLRAEFAAIVAHDLRNPIQAILLQIQALQRYAHDGSATVPSATLERLERGADRLARMVEDLLDATRIEVSHLTLMPQAVSLPQAVSALVERIRPTLGTHAVETSTEGEPPAAFVDPTRLDQILTNLIENAAKYSSDGAPIVISVRPTEGGSQVSVADRGPGIAPEDLPRLFNRYYQAKRAREQKSGLGLGLYITKGLVQASGGRIDVRSELGRGSVFSVWLPRAVAS